MEVNMKEEKMEILKMLEAKKISAEDAERLLAALEESEKSGQGKKAKTLKIRVYEKGGEKPKVNINIPITWAKVLRNFMPQKLEEKLGVKDIDFDKISEMIASGQQEKLVEVNDDGKKVEIYVE
jgi:hypothetical protein